jgi:hypothetical protein
LHRRQNVFVSRLNQKGNSFTFCYIRPSRAYEPLIPFRKGVLSPIPDALPEHSEQRLPIFDVEKRVLDVQLWLFDVEKRVLDVGLWLFDVEK